MRSQYRYAMFATCFAFVVTSVASAQGITQREYVRQLESAPSDAIVQYCRTKAPEAKGQIDEGYTNYLSSLDKAMDMWVSSNPELEHSLASQIPMPNAKSVQASIQNISNTVLGSIKQYDAHQYCAWMATKLKSTTPQSLLELLHEYEARARVASRAGGQLRKPAIGVTPAQLPFEYGEKWHRDSAFIKRQRAIEVQYGLALSQRTEEILKDIELSTESKCNFTVTLLPGGQVIGADFSACKFDPVLSDHMRSALIGEEMPYKGYESVFQRTYRFQLCTLKSHCVK